MPAANSFPLPRPTELGSREHDFSSRALRATDLPRSMSSLVDSHYLPATSQYPGFPSPLMAFGVHAGYPSQVPQVCIMSSKVRHVDTTILTCPQHQKKPSRRSLELAALREENSNLRFQLQDISAELVRALEDTQSSSRAGRTFSPPPRDGASIFSGSRGDGRSEEVADTSQCNKSVSSIARPKITRVKTGYRFGRRTRPRFNGAHRTIREVSTSSEAQPIHGEDENASYSISYLDVAPAFGIRQQNDTVAPELFFGRSEKEHDLNKATSPKVGQAIIDASSVSTDPEHKQVVQKILLHHFGTESSDDHGNRSSGPQQPQQAAVIGYPDLKFVRETLLNHFGTDSDDGCIRSGMGHQVMQRAAIDLCPIDGGHKSRIWSEGSIDSACTICKAPTPPLETERRHEWDFHTSYFGIKRVFVVCEECGAVHVTA